MKYQSHSDTSYAAAIASLETADTLRAKVYRAIAASADGLTDEEIQRSLQLNPSTQRPRRIELVEMGFVHDSKCVRKTLSGRDAVVWIRKPNQSPAVQGELF